MQPLTVVRLRRDLPRGTIVEELDANTVLVEFADERGQTLECVPVPKVLLEPERQRLSTSPLLDVTAVQVLPGFTLRITFENGEVRRYSMSRLLAPEATAFSPLRKVVLFRQAFVAHGTVCWPNGADIAPELLYQQSVPESDGSLVNALTEMPNVGEDADFCYRSDGIAKNPND